MLPMFPALFRSDPFDPKTPFETSGIKRTQGRVGLKSKGEFSKTEHLGFRGDKTIRLSEE